MASPVILDLNDSNDDLRWPKQVAIDHLARLVRRSNRSSADDEANRFLSAAFRGRRLAETYAESLSAHGRGDGFTLAALLAELPAARESSAPRPFWSQRRGMQPHDRLPFEGVLKRFLALVGELDKEGLWSEELGYDWCPDGHGNRVTTPDVVIDSRVGRLLPFRSWPPRPAAENASTLDHLLDLIEALYDMASWPGTWSGHNYGGCKGHPASFDWVCSSDLAPVGRVVLV